MTFLKNCSCTHLNQLKYPFPLPSINVINNFLFFITTLGRDAVLNEAPIVFHQKIQYTVPERVRDINCEQLITLNAYVKT